MKIGALLRLAAVLAVLHFAALAISFSVGFSSTMERFDAAVHMDASLLETAATYAARVLAQPGLAAWDVINSNRTTSRFVQWLVVIANSVFWGAVLAALIMAFTTRRAR
jgi:hypothetical protein